MQGWPEMMANPSIQKFEKIIFKETAYDHIILNSLLQKALIIKSYSAGLFLC